MKIAQKIAVLLSTPEWTQAKLAEELGVSQSTINRWTKGTEPEGHHRDALSDLFNARMGWTSANDMMPASGTVTAGRQIIEMFELNEETWVPKPAGFTENTKALTVQPGALEPMYSAGTYIYYSTTIDPNDAAGYRGLIKVKNGPIYLRKLRYSEMPGKWTLSSENSHDLINREVEWFSPIDWVYPSKPVIF